tara:strand:+ start:270 stop:1004 length:735 start_codon:yes stop_codon:yes gene_type:complete
MKKELKISIITCCKNSMPYLEDNIKSIKNQNYKNYEQLFILSKSYDGTYEFLRKKRKKIFKFETNNIYKCINLGIKKSKGDIIFLLHSDDKIINKNLFKKINQLFQNKDLDFIYGNCLITKRDNIKKVIRKWKSKNIKKSKNFMIDLPAHTSFFIKKIIYQKIKYDTSYYIASDFDFLIKIFKKFSGLYFDYNFIYMRTGGTSSEIRNFKNKMIEDISIIKKYYSFSFLIIYLLKLLFKIKQKI